MQRDEAAHDGQPQSQAAVRPIERLPLLHEDLEDARLHLGRDADSVVAHPDQHPSFPQLGGDGDAAPLGRVLGGVRQQVRHHLGQPLRIAVDGQRVVRQVENQLVPPLLQQRAGHLDRFGDEVGGIHPGAPQVHLAARDAGDVEHVVDEADEMPGLALDDGALPFQLAVPALPHQVQGGGDGRQRVAELVAQHGQEFVFGAARRLEGALAGLQLVGQGFRPLPGAHLLRDLHRRAHHPRDPAVRLTHREQVELEEAVLEGPLAVEGGLELLGDERLAGTKDLVEHAP